MLGEISKILNDSKKVRELQMVCLQIGELKAKRNALILREKDARRVVAEINKLKAEFGLKIRRPKELKVLFGEEIDRGIDRVCRDSITVSF